MSRRYVPLLLLLSSIWGSSYLFIKVAVEEIEPTTMIALRLVLTAPILLGFVVWRSGREHGVAQLRAAAPAGFVLGITNAAIPFTLIAWGEKHIDSGIAAIANASVPIFVALLAARLVPSERVAGLRLLGVVLGLVGVGVLVGVRPSGGWWAVAGTLAVVAASLAYAWSSLFAQPRVSRTTGPALAAASMTAGAFVMVPLGLAQLPEHVPSWKALGSVAALGILGTAFAQLILYRMLHLHGSSRTTLVSYLIPVTALFYGAVILSEPIRASALAGLVLILAGVALGSGLLRSVRRAAVSPAP